MLSYARPNAGSAKGVRVSSRIVSLDKQPQMTERARRRSIVLFSASMIFFWASLYIYVPILSVYANFLGAAPAVVGLVVGVYGFSQLVVRIPLGLWSDHLGKRKPFVVMGMFLAAAGCLAMVLTPDPWYLVGGRAVIGLAAATWVCSTVLFSSYFPLSQAVKAMGLATFFSSAPQIATSWAGGYLAESYGWTFPFYVGIGLAALGLIGVIGVEEVPIRRPQSISWERFRRIGTTPLLVAVSAIGILNHFSIFATTYTFVPIYATSLGASKSDLGTILTASMVASSAATLIAFRVSNRFGDGATVTAGMVIGGLITLATPLVGDLWVLTALQFGNGVARGLIYPVLMGLCVRMVSAKDRATSVGIFQASYALGMFTGPFLGGVIVEQAGLASMFVVMGLVSLLGAMLSAWGIRVSLRALALDSH